MLIKNFSDLVGNPSREIALKIAEAGLSAINTGRVVEKSVHLKNNTLIIKGNKFNLKNFKRIFVVGAGKCAAEAAAALERILGDRITDGIVLSLSEKKLKKIKVYRGDHPRPTARNVKATEKIIKFLSGVKKSDLVIFIISGGGSALLCRPKRISYRDEARVFECLTNAGADIKKINIVRKHLSLARGGNLAKYAYPAKAVSLIFSDVLGDDLAFISSGPTVFDGSTIGDAGAVLKEFSVEKRCGNINKGLMETPKDKKYFKNIKNILAVSNKIALSAMKEAGKNSGLAVCILDASMSGEASVAGRKIADNLHQVGPKNILLYGGETTVTVKKKGKGGRNMELALSARRFLKDDELILALASDGRDNTDFAGAICDKITREKAKKSNLNIEKFLENNNSYEFFKKTKDAVITGDTGSNVSDLIIAIKK